MVHPKINKLFNRLKLSTFLLPLTVLCLIFVYTSTKGLIHDYSNNYFPALLATEGIAPETVVFDIFDFNKYIWSKGYSKELTDFYLNSPFITTLFYPLALLKNAYYSKLIFNLFCIFLLIFTLTIFGKNYLEKKQWPFFILLPILFFIPIKNNLEFGQLYLLITSFSLIGYHYIITKNKFAGELLLTISIFTKIFPLFYCLPLLYNKKWKSILTILVFSILLLLLSILVGGWAFWEIYLFDVLPNAILNESTVDYRSNAQSIDVFLKTLFVRDSYYNPDALFNNVITFKVISLLIKFFIYSIAITLSFKHKDQLLKALSIWVVTLFLTQPRTATYAQILWLIPAIEVVKSNHSKNLKLVFFSLLVLVCNFPFHWLRETLLFVEFSRLWLSIGLAFISFRIFKLQLNSFLLKVFLVLFTPFLILTLLKKVDTDNSEYVLKPNNLFMIHNFQKDGDILAYNALGKNGNETFRSNIKIETLDTVSCRIINNQVFYKETQLTNNYAIKKKPVLVNECYVYYLTDHHSRRGAFTLKKVNICLESKVSL